MSRIKFRDQLAVSAKSLGLCVAELPPSVCVTKPVRQRGVWPSKRTDIVSYASITRVRASAGPLK
jgi:hypothetical protein